MIKRAVKHHAVIQGRVGCKYPNIGHGRGLGNLLWWWDGKSDRLHRRHDRGGTFHCDIVPRVDDVYRGRIEVSTGRASILPPLAIYAHTEPDKLLVPVSLVQRLRRLGGVFFYVDTKAGLRRLSAKTAVDARINEAKTKKVSLPEVGIFWIDDSGTMFADSVSLPDAEDSGAFKDYGNSHYVMWAKAVRTNPKWSGKEYEQIPRGRVVYKKDPKKPEFIVYMAKVSAKFKNKVIRRFHLPVGYVRFDFTDIHYQM